MLVAIRGGLVTRRPGFPGPIDIISEIYYHIMNQRILVLACSVIWVLAFCASDILIVQGEKKGQGKDLHGI